MALGKTRDYCHNRRGASTHLCWSAPQCSDQQAPSTAAADASNAAVIASRSTTPPFHTMKRSDGTDKNARHETVEIAVTQVISAPWRPRVDLPASGQDDASSLATMSSIRSQPSAIDVRHLGHRRLPHRLAAAARPGRRPSRRRQRHVAVARASAGLHRRSAHRAAGTTVRRHSRRRHRPRRQDHLARPGQLVGYPIIGLAEPLDVINYVRRLEESLIKVCADVGLDTSRVEGRSGVWVPGSAGRPDRKVAAIGVRVVACHHAARLCAQLRLRSGRVPGHRALRHQRCRGDVGDGRIGTPRWRRRRPRGGRRCRLRRPGRRPRP